MFHCMIAIDKSDHLLFNESNVLSTYQKENCIDHVVIID